jgi:hypothetical protein
MHLLAEGSLELYDLVQSRTIYSLSFTRGAKRITLAYVTRTRKHKGKAGWMISCHIRLRTKQEQQGVGSDAARTKELPASVSNFEQHRVLAPKCVKARSGNQCIKGIVSWVWEQLQWNPSDRSEEFRTAGAYFYSFLMPFSCFNSKKAIFGGFSFDSM